MNGEQYTRRDAVRALGLGLASCVLWTNRTQAADEQPLRRAIELMQAARQTLDQVTDYSCVFVKRERIDGKLGEHEHLAMKIRHQPFSVYTRFVAPEALKGREAIYVAGKNDGKIVAHGVGLQKLAGTVNLDPTSGWAMKGNRFPVTNAGMKNLVLRLIAMSERELPHGEADVQFLVSKIEGRPCTCLQVMHPQPRKHFDYFLTRLYIDDATRLPIRSEMYEWPKRAGDPPVLVGEYTFTKIQLNVGLTDLDFDAANPAYEY